MSFAGFQGQEAKDFDWPWLGMDPPEGGWGPSPAGADSVDIKGESDAAIGANGEKIQNYIQENEAIVSRPLNLGETGMTGPEVSAGMPSSGIGGIGYDDRTSDWDDSPGVE